MDSEIANAYVRPIVTVIITGVFCYLSLVGKITPDVFVPTAAAVIMYFFKSRDEAKIIKMKIGKSK